MWETILTTFSEKCLKKRDRLSTLIFRLNHKNIHNKIGATVEEVPKQVRAPKLKNVLAKFRN